MRWSSVTMMGTRLCRVRLRRRSRRFATEARPGLAPLPEPWAVTRAGAAGGPGQVVLAPPMPVVEEPFDQRISEVGTPGAAGGQPDHRVGPLRGRPQQRMQL